MKILGDRNEWRKTVIAEANKLLSEKPVKTTTVERIQLIEEIDDRVKHLPHPLRYGHDVKYLLEHVSTPIEPYDLILGRAAEKVPDAAEEAWLERTWAKFGKWPDSKDSRPQCFYDGGHSSCDWQDVIRHGLSGLYDRAVSEKARRAAAGEKQEKLDFLEGMMLVLTGIRIFLRRYADAAQAMGLEEAAQACRHAADRAPETFREALQMLWAIQFVYCSYIAINPTLTYGRLDQFLYPLYEKDLAQGRLTREEAGMLILDYYSKNNLNMGRGEHQLSGEDETLSTGWLRNLNFDAPQYLLVGGCDTQGNPVTNDLSELFVEQIQPKFKNPVVIVRYTKGMRAQYPNLWKNVARAMRSSASMMVYNDQQIIPAHVRAGAEYADATQYEFFGCNWPCLPGIETHNNNALDLWGKHTDPQEIRQRRQEAYRNYSTSTDLGGMLYVLQSYPENACPQSIDEIYEDFRRKYREGLQPVFRFHHWMRERYELEDPGALQFKDCFYRDVIWKAKSFAVGTCKYHSQPVLLVGFATLVDSFIALDEVVFRQKAVSFERFRKAVANNFDGEEALLQLCRSILKLGSDDAQANEHGRRMLELLTDTISEVEAQLRAEGYKPILFWPCMQTDTAHIRVGAALSATPDGRLAGEPVSQNSQPSIGASINGLTARLRSYAQLPFDRVTSGANNLSIQPHMFQGEAGLDLLGAVTATYFELGGLQLQISAVESEELLEAQKHPEKYRDLMVRITGYSAIFVDMTKQAQDDIIRREMTSL